MNNMEMNHTNSDNKEDLFRRILEQLPQESLKSDLDKRVLSDLQKPHRQKMSGSEKKFLAIILVISAVLVTVLFVAIFSYAGSDEQQPSKSNWLIIAGMLATFSALLLIFFRRLASIKRSGHR